MNFTKKIEKTLNSKKSNIEKNNDNDYITNYLSRKRKSEKSSLETKNYLYKFNKKKKGLHWKIY